MLHILEDLLTYKEYETWVSFKGISLARSFVRTSRVVQKRMWDTQTAGDILSPLCLLWK